MLVHEHAHSATGKRARALPNGEDERNDKDFFTDLVEDVKDECGKYGTVVDAKILPATPGHVYMKFSDENGATTCIGALNNRWFAGKQITAAFVPEAEYSAA